MILIDAATPDGRPKLSKYLSSNSRENVLKAGVLRVTALHSR